MENCNNNNMNIHIPNLHDKYIIKHIDDTVPSYKLYKVNPNKSYYCVNPHNGYDEYYCMGCKNQSNSVYCKTCYDRNGNYGKFKFPKSSCIENSNMQNIKHFTGTSFNPSFSRLDNNQYTCKDNLGNHTSCNKVIKQLLFTKDNEINVIKPSTDTIHNYEKKNNKMNNVFYAMPSGGGYERYADDYGRAQQWNICKNA
jgi:hypothetical protein